MNIREAINILDPKEQGKKAVKAAYNEKARIAHPDKGGTDEAMKIINEAYEVLENAKFQWEDEDYNEKTIELSQDILNVVNELYKSFYNKFNNNVFTKYMNIELCGTFLWIELNHREVKNHFKKANGYKGDIETEWKWSKGKGRYYFTASKYRKKSKKELSMNQIRDYYGNSKVDFQNTKQIEA